MAENVLGTIGTVLWSFQLVPQILKSYRSKDTDGLSAWLLFIWVAGSIPQATYLVVQNINIPLIIQPQLFSAFAIIAMAQCWHYSHRLSTYRCILGALATAAIAGTVEVAFYFLCKLGENRGTSAATKTMGIVGAVLIVAGLIPQYYEILRLKEVRGISMWFLAIDCSGGVFSLLSLVFKHSFDAIAAANYIGIVVLEVGIFGCYLFLNPKAARRRLQRERSSSEVGSQPAATTSTPLPPPPSSTTATSAAPTNLDLKNPHQTTTSNDNTPDWSAHTTCDEKQSLTLATPVQPK